MIYKHVVILPHVWAFVDHIQGDNQQRKNETVAIYVATFVKILS
jgi:hypothetical protein